MDHNEKAATMKISKIQARMPTTVSLCKSAVRMCMFLYEVKEVDCCTRMMCLWRMWRVGSFLLEMLKELEELEELEAVEELEELEVLRVMRCIYLVCWMPWRVSSVCWRYSRCRN